MLQRTVLVFAAMLIVFLLGPDTRADELLRVNVFPGPQHLALYVAKERGLFAKRGLNVEISFTPNAKAQRDGLADGSIDIAQAAVDNAVAMVEVGKKDVIIVAGGGNGMLNLFVRPEIKSYDDIRGKAVVVDSPDTAYAFVLYKMLALKGLKKADYGVFQGGDCMDDTLTFVELVEIFDAEVLGVLCQRGDLFGAFRIRIGLAAVGRRNIVVDHGQRLVRRVHLAASDAQAFEGLRRGDLVHQVAIDVDQARSIRLFIHQMVIPDLVVECARFHGPGGG